MPPTCDREASHVTEWDEDIPETLFSLFCLVNPTELKLLPKAVAPARAAAGTVVHATIKKSAATRGNTAAGAPGQEREGMLRGAFFVGTGYCRYPTVQRDVAGGQ